MRKGYNMKIVKGKKLTYDIEVLPNYFLASFKVVGSKKVFSFEIRGRENSLTKEDRENFFELLNNNTIITFNGRQYDIPLTSHAVEGLSTYKIYRLSSSLINKSNNWWQVLLGNMTNVDHIDLIEVAPSQASLKLYGTRLGSRKLWEFPLDPTKDISKKEMKMLLKYNVNDLKVTEDLFNALHGQLDLREKMSDEYGIDLRSKSDAQIAEAVLIKQLEVDRNVKIHKPSRVTYRVPKFISFKTEILKDLLIRLENTSFEINPKNGSPMMPKWLSDTEITIGSTKYNIGIGGLHSQESSMAVENEEGLMNADFSSYYPFIILELELFPKHLGAKFLKIYKDIVYTRLEAKKNGNKLVADSLKITINGSFGKLGSIYSKLYSPDLLVRVTITGQLLLLKIIEALEIAGVEVVSANTDGLEMKKTKDAKKIEAIIEGCIKDTSFIMEYGSYKALYAENVNNYVAVYDGYTKAKGIYAEPSLAKNRQTPIVFKAIRQFLLDGTSIEKTINECTDINEFVTARTVKGGGMWCEYDDSLIPEGWEESLARYKRVTKVMEKKKRDMMRGSAVYVGKVVRFYYAKNGGFMFYQESGNTVPMSDGCKPIMNLPKKNKLPDDIDYDWYINYAHRKLVDLGYLNK